VLGKDKIKIEKVFTFGEVLEPYVREQVQSAFSAQVIDCYSSMECGMLALQCPDSALYHVMAEGVLLEVVDERNRPCLPGQFGRVLVTVLQNFANPLIRYEIGDYAQVGPPCPCGRGLPTLRRIVGRARNLLTLPDGNRRWPFPHSMEFAGRDPVQQFQIAQIAIDEIEARLVLSRPFTEPEKREFERSLIEAVDHPFRISFRFVDEIPRSAGGKFEDFVGLPSKR